MNTQTKTPKGKSGKKPVPVSKTVINPVVEPVVEPVITADRNQTTFIPPVKGFQFTGTRTMKDGSMRFYLVKVSYTGTLMAYVWDESGKPIIENGLPLVLKRVRINSIPGAELSLKLTQDMSLKLDSKEYREKEISYLQTIELPTLGQLSTMKLNEIESAKLADLSQSYSKVNQRNSSVFRSQVRTEIKSRY